MYALSTAEIAWYATGRFYVAVDRKVADSGYFLHLAGIEGPLFSGAPSESSAHFTFAAEPFLAHTIKNGDPQWSPSSDRPSPLALSSAEQGVGCALGHSRERPDPLTSPHG